MTHPQLNPGAENADLGTEFYTPMETVYAQYGAGQRMVLIDARPSGDYILEHISGAISVPFYAVEEHLDRIPIDAPVVAYCACPHAERYRSKCAHRSGLYQCACARRGILRLERFWVPHQRGPKSVIEN